MAGTWRAPPGWQLIRQQVFAAKGRKCWWCGSAASTVDHVVAQVLGGGDEIGNLVPSCARCNYSRGAALGNRIRGRRRLDASRRTQPAPTFKPSRDW